jgi:hypothetical protein
MGTGAELEEAPVELHGVIALDGALVLEGADAVEVCGGWCGPPGGFRVRRRTSESGVVAREKPIEHALGLGERAGVGQPQFDDETILEGAKESFDAALRLWGMGTDPADAEFLEGAPDLGGLGSALELLGHGERGAGIAVKDPMAIGVGGDGQAIAADEVAQEAEVAVGVLFVAEDPAEHPAGRVIEGGMEHQPRAAIFKPGMVTAVQLNEEPRLGHALPATAMPRGPTGAGTTQPGRAEKPLHSPPRDTQTFALREQLGDVVIIRPGIASAGQREDASPYPLGEPAGRRPPAIAMSEGRESVLPPARKEPAHMAQREAGQVGGRLRREPALLDLSEQMHAQLFLLGQRNRLPDHRPRVTDSLAR